MYNFLFPIAVSMPAGAVWLTNLANGDSVLSGGSLVPLGVTVAACIVVGTLVYKSTRVFSQIEARLSELERKVEELSA